MCTWWLQHRKLQVMFKASRANLQTFIYTPNGVLEDHVQYSTDHGRWLKLFKILYFCVFFVLQSFGAQRLFNHPVQAITFNGISWTPFTMKMVDNCDVMKDVWSLSVGSLITHFAVSLSCEDGLYREDLFRTFSPSLVVLKFCVLCCLSAAWPFIFTLRKVH